MNYANLSTTGSSNNMGGMAIVLLYAPISYFTPGGIKKAPANPATLEESVTITQNHEFLPGKGFHSIRSILDTNKLKSDIVGERGGRGMKAEYECKISGNTKLMAALTAKFKNDEFIVLAKMHDGTYIQLGSEDLPAEILPTHDTGTIENGVNSMMAKITTFELSRNWYEGTITHMPAPVLTSSQHEASVSFSSLGDGDSINLDLGGNIIATAEYTAGDSLVDFLFKLYESLADIGIAFGVNPILQDGQLVIRTFDYLDFDWSGATIVVEVLAGSPVVSNPASLTFVPI